MGRRGGAEASLATLDAIDAIDEAVRPTTLAREQRLEVLDALQPLLPTGLRRGSTVAVGGPTAMSLAYAVAAGPSIDESWVAAVGFPSLGLLAASEFGIRLERFALVAAPRPAEWATVVAALVDAFELVLVRATHRISPTDARRLTARARERGAVLLQVGGSAWPDKAETTLTVTDARWEGLGEGHGHLCARRVRVTASGRRDAVRARHGELWLPGSDGRVEAAYTDPVPLHRVS